MIASPKSNTIYLIKCLGICLIIVEHILTYQQPVYYDNPFVTMVKASSMPTFMMLSGYVVSKKPLNDAWLGGKFLKLVLILSLSLIGYYLWWLWLPNLSLLKLETPMNIVEFVSYNFYSGFAILVTWYVFVMLQCYVFLSLMWQINLAYPKAKLPLLAGILIIILNVIPSAAVGLNYLKWYGSFMFIGYVIGSYRECLKKYLWLSYVGIGLFLAFGFATGWMTNWQDLLYGRGGYTNIATDITMGKFALLAVMLVSVFAGSLAMLGVSRLIEKIKFIQRPLIYMGSNVMGVYLLHPLFVGISRNVAVASVLSVVFSLALFVIGRYLWSKTIILRKKK